MRGLIGPPCQTIISSSFPGRSVCRIVRVGFALHFNVSFNGGALCAVQPHLARLSLVIVAFPEETPVVSPTALIVFLSEPDHFSKRRGVVRKVIVFILLLCGIASSGLAQDLAGDWVGQMNGVFKFRIHFEKTESGYSGKLINPSDNETVLDQITSDRTQVHFAVNKLNLSYDGEWNEQEKVWTGNLTFQQVYPLILRRATAEDIGNSRPQAPARRRDQCRTGALCAAGNPVPRQNVVDLLNE